MREVVFLLCVCTSALFGSNSLREHLGFNQVDRSKIDRLVANQYYGAFRLGYGAGEYLNDNFGLSTIAQDPSRQSITWVTTPGSYGEFRAYWIFRPNIRQCWQARNVNGPLAFWNADGKAKGNPEDWELFVFEFADADRSSVVIRNVYGRYVRHELFDWYAPGHLFSCDAERASAAEFFPEF